MKNIDVKIENCWAKLEKKTKVPTQNIITHSFLAGYVAKYIIEELINPFLHPNSLIDLSIIPYIALHDYGKIHMSFLSKSKIWIEGIIKNKNLSEEMANKLRRVWSITQDYSGSYQRTKEEYHHTVIGANLFYEVIPHEKDICQKTIETCFDIINLHHGYKRGGYSRINSVDNLGIDLSNSRECFVGLVEKEFGELKNYRKTETSIEMKALIQGVTIISDWVASSIDFVENEIPKKDMIRIIKTKLEKINFIKTNDFLIRSLSFSDCFSYTMNEFQKKVDSLVLSKKTKGSVFFIEAETGLGKTEAALWLVYKILQLTLANGFYFAFPTQITSNHIYSRINNFLNIIYSKWPGQNKTKLIHSMGFLSEENEKFLEEVGNRFYDRNKVSLIYPFGIGTVDQMLLSVINARHADLRLYGLANKVIIIDELHSYSTFTQVLLKEAINKLRKLGCIIIILSATLTSGAKKYLLEEEFNDNEYPSIQEVKL